MVGERCGRRRRPLHRHHRPARWPVAADGTLGNTTAAWPTISADGRFVAVTSWATNLVAGDTNGQPDVFVYDTVNGATTMVSVAGDGAQGDGPSGGGVGFRAYGSAISPDGRLVAFRSLAANLVPGDTNGDVDLFVRDIAAGTTTKAGVPPQGRPLVPGGALFNVAMAGNGVLAFAAWDLREGTFQMYRRDLATGTTVLASRASDGTIGNNHSFQPAVSADGRVLAFTSGVDNLVPDDTNARSDLFVRGPFP